MNQDQFPYQLTHPVNIRATLNFATRQLEKYGAKEGEDFEVREDSNSYGPTFSVYTKGTRRWDTSIFKKYDRKLADFTEDTHEDGTHRTTPEYSGMAQ